MTTPRAGHAVVLGASMAGLLAARALADTYRHVTLVDRDELPVGPEPRRGVPQGRHAHVLLSRGQQVLERLFPGLTGDLVAGGAPIGDVLADGRLFFNGHLLSRTDTGTTAVGASRSFLEHHVRERVRARPGVTVASARDVLGVTTTADARRVTGVRVLRRAQGSAQEVLDADLVVDATGRGSRVPVWLEALGYPRPTEDRVPIDLGYTTCCYRLPDDALGGDLGALQAPSPDHPRGGGLTRLEGGRWMLTLAGVRGDHPPADADGFLAFARSLRFPDIHEAVRDAEPLDEPVPFRFPAAVRRRYERLERLPERLVVVGDGLCSFNPIYGQGMSVAALEALTLAQHLRLDPRVPGRDFHRAVARVVDTPWALTVAGDLAFPGVEGRRTVRHRAAAAYIARLHAAAERDPALGRAFMRVTGLVDPPTALLRPGVAVRVLRPGRTRRLRRARGAGGTPPR
jgi:2-polyprenyl-6-methoxyphenol hydroxylase-like FAD-dependent oxidoreductase